MKQKLIDLVHSTGSKQISQAVKRDSELSQWVHASPGTTIAEKIYNTLYPDQSICNRGHDKKFKSLAQGYGFCGTAAHCVCAKESVSNSVSNTKSTHTTTQRAETQQKRTATTLQKYGVSNVGQTLAAKTSHKNTYLDIDKNNQIVAKVQATKILRYHDANFNNPGKIKETYRQKRQAGFWVNKFPEKNISALENKEQLLALYNSNTPVEIADQLNVHIQTVYRYLNAHGIREPFRSADEQELVRFIQSLGITNIVQNTRKLLPSGKEIDVYLPDLGIAIEYNGVYWHHEDVAHITRDYHYNKFNECEQLGIQLITIFSNFWHAKKDIVKNVLRVKLQQYKDTTIYARKCAVQQVDNITAKQFLNKHHIQGYTPSTTCLGLYHSDVLIALMTFSKARTGIGKQSTDTELVRFAASGLVVGGAGKLLRFYKKLHPTEIIISYSDNEWSTGALYKTLGFKLVSEVKYSYWYLKPREHRLYHRFTFSKQKLIKQGHDAAKSESEITREMGLLKVWDCGKRKWRLT